MIPFGFAHWLRPRAAPQPQPIPPLVEQLREECEAMARYALHHGLPVAPELIAQLGPLIDRQMPPQATPHHALAAIHRKLAAAIAPATPQAVTLLDAQHRSDHPFPWLGPVPLIRLLTSAAIAFLIAVIATGMSPDVSSANIDRGFLDSDGAPLLWNTLFLLFCAGLGASFATLFQAHRYVAAATYDPKYDASYCARLILGVIAGLILVEMLPAHLFDGGSMHNFGKPTLAMLGGFSATAVHRLLQRLVDALETLVRGDRSADADAAMQTYRARAASERTQWQSEFAANLIDLQQSFDSNASPEAMRQRLADFTRAMLAATDSPASTPPPPSNRPSKE
ncbi:membrane protein [Burkholderiaceae bacterium 26]|nr:membrane protein [Burkholderiaceae bacterium 26]